MSARIFKFRNKGKAFDHLEVDKSGYWHLVPGRDVIKELFEELRGGDNSDYVDIAEFSKGEETLIQFAGLDGEAPNPGKANVMLGLRDFVTENTPDDLSSMGGISARRDDRGNNAVYAQGDGRIVAVGYYDNAKSDKGIMMAALILYVFAIINMDKDQDLAKTVYNYLPFYKEVGCDFSFYNYADNLVDQLAY